MSHNEIFIRAEKEQAFTQHKQEIDKKSIVFIEESGKEAIHTQNKTYYTIPSNGKDGQYLVFTKESEEKEGRAVWKDFNQLDALSYGVRWLTSSSDPAITRVGNMAMHKELPIQSAMKGCVYDATTNEVVYWLDENDWRFREDHPTRKLTLQQNQNSTGYLTELKGTHTVEKKQLDGIIPADNKYAVGVYIKCKADPTLILKCIGFTTNGSGEESESEGKYVFKAVTEQAKEETTADTSVLDSEQEYEIGSNRTGYDGEVRVRIPEFWYKSWDNKEAKEVRISTVNVGGDWYKSKEMYLSAYLNSKVCHDQNNNTEGNKSYLHRVVGSDTTAAKFTLFSIANECLNGSTGKFRNGETDQDNTNDKHQWGRGSTVIPRSTARDFMPTNTHICSYLQYKVLTWLYVIEYANFNSQAEFDATLTDEGFHKGGLGAGCTEWEWNAWTIYNDNKPLIPNGYTDSLGNKTGTAFYTLDKDSTSKQTLKVPRYRGIENPFGHIWRNLDGIIIDVNSSYPNNMNEVWVTDDPTHYSDTLDKSKFWLAGHEINSSNYIKEFDLQDSAEIIPIENNGNSATTYKCDYHYTNNSSSSLRTLLVGGSARHGGTAGLFYFYSDHAVSFSSAYVGFWSVIQP